MPANNAGTATLSTPNKTGHRGHIVNQETSQPMGQMHIVGFPPEGAADGSLVSNETSPWMGAYAMRIGGTPPDQDGWQDTDGDLSTPI